MTTIIAWPSPDGGLEDVRIPLMSARMIWFMLASVKDSRPVELSDVRVTTTQPELFANDIVSSDDGVHTLVNGQVLYDKYHPDQ